MRLRRGPIHTEMVPISDWQTDAYVRLFVAIIAQARKDLQPDRQDPDRPETYHQRQARNFLQWLQQEWLP